MNTLMTHIVGGYPSMKESEQLVLAMEKAGVAYVEIQIPFSDPVADGPTIMEANQKSLENGTNPDDCLKLMKRLKKKVNIPLLFMTYYNIIFSYGLESFCQQAKEAGCYGLIVPDIPLDEEPYDHYLKTCKKYGLHPIQIISPITPADRLKKIGKIASGFVYCVSRLGTTGAQDKLDLSLVKYLDTVRKYVKVPLALGFGISNRQQVEEALKKADIAVIGSKVINLYNQSQSIASVQKFLEDCMR
ncbi:MAG: tryptophan synthase subunit alpha [bacterium]|nr:tryptophan synthase subunit alpha [bacterium]